MVEEKDFQVVVNEYAQGAIENLREMLDAVEHAQECSGKVDCPECDGHGTVDANPEPDKECPKCAGDGQIICPSEHHDEDSAQQTIDNDPLSIEVRSGWYTPGQTAQAEEYCILLGTGGPASRITGDLSEHGEPESARFEYQDWFKPWTAAHTTSEQDDTLLEYARHFYYGE